ncbi:ABC transporter permease [Actinopolymorpha alba]|uniref:ABC transporter permease n=1 Tax=Actinopolymorpha alba TaxID=533267 RepID=UPI00035E88C7|nr:ABC transporter permease [Actinopolymorpha alba]
MTATPAMPVPTRPGRTARVPLAAAGRLLRLELRRNVMLWLLPIVAALFWLVTYRPAMAYPPLWNVRAMTMQTSASAVFVPTVVGAAAWLGSREARHGMTDLLSGVSRPRWVRQLATWAATTCWALVAYLGCVAALYAVTAQQGAWGGPLWWPAAVGAASLPAFSALGFAAGALRPSRFTAPLVAVAAFLALELTAQFIQGDDSPWQVSPLVAGPWEIGADHGVATFYRYLPDLPIVQLMFLAGLTAALLGVLGLPAGSGGRWVRRFTAGLTTAGVLAAVTATALAGTGRLDPHGMIAIPALHNPANDRPVPYTPVCGDTPIPVCLHPAYASYLPTLTAALEPVLGELAGLPGAPARIDQAAATYRQESGNGVSISSAGPAMRGTPPTLHLLLPFQLARSATTDELTSELRTNTAREILNSVIGGDRRRTTDAQQAVAAAILKTSTLPPGSPTANAAQRFAALPPATRHAWLTRHVAALRAGQLTLAELP